MEKPCIQYDWINSSPRHTRLFKIHSPGYISAHICALAKIWSEHWPRKHGPYSQSLQETSTKTNTGCIAAFSPRIGAVTVRLLFRLCLLYQGLQLLLLLENLEEIEQEWHVVVLPPHVLRLPLLQLLFLHYDLLCHSLDLAATSARDCSTDGTCLLAEGSLICCNRLSLFLWRSLSSAVYISFWFFKIAITLNLISF